MKRTKLVLTTVAGSILFAGTALAGDVQYSSGSLKVIPSESLSKMTLTVSGPDGLVLSEYSGFGTPSLSLFSGGDLLDGVYTWQLTGATREKLPESRSKLNNGRPEGASRTAYKGSSESGTFRIVNGVFFGPDESMTETVFNTRKDFELENK